MIVRILKNVQVKRNNLEWLHLIEFWQRAGQTLHGRKWHRNTEL